MCLPLQATKEVVSVSSIEYAHRFAPCPVYDLEGREHWLEKLALEGTGHINLQG